MSFFKFASPDAVYEWHFTPNTEELDANVQDKKHGGSQKACPSLTDAVNTEASRWPETRSTNPALKSTLKTAQPERNAQH